jgi:transcriptional antiterminator RfaH
MKHWYALYTKPGKEHQVNSILESQGFKTYLPIIQMRKNSRRKTRPFFSCYLFICVDPVDALREVRWTPGLRRIVSFGEQPAIVGDGVIDVIRHRLKEMEASGYPVEPSFKSGDRVLIKSGPLRDLEAVFDEPLSSWDRAKVLVGILGRLTTCEIELDCLEKVTRQRPRRWVD